MVPEKSPLKAYVDEKDGFSWSHLSSEEVDGASFHLLRLQSQKWKSTVWEHWLRVVEPKDVRLEHGLLVVSGGRNGDAPPELDGLVELAYKSGSVVAELRMVPNQPLLLDGEAREEDALIAYTWGKFFETKDPTWLARFPMTRAVVRAMDALEEFLSLSKFVLAGKSKRGWAAWTAAGVDERVCGVVPCVIDLLNLKRSMEHHYRAYGDWAPALKDYEAIHGKWHDEDFARLLELVAPMSFQRDIPKYIINSTGDEFFLPDSSRFYFDDLKGPKCLRYVPNTDHGLKGSNYNQGIAAFYRSLVQGEQLPNFTWKRNGQHVSIETDIEPIEARIWYAHNPKARDFRLSAIGPNWVSQELDGDEIELDSEDEGWTAHMIELKYADGLVLTTDVFVTPDVLPYKFEVKGSC